MENQNRIRTAKVIQKKRSTTGHRVQSTMPHFKTSGGGIAGQEFANTARRKPQSPAPQLISSASHRSLSHTSSRDGSLSSISDIEKYLSIDENGNIKLTEELKSSEDMLKSLQTGQQNKYKQLQLKYAEERKHWMDKTKELEDQIAQMELTLKYTQNKLRDKVEENTLLQSQLDMVQQQLNELPPQTRAEAQERLKLKQQQEKKIKDSQQTLYNQIDVQTQQLLQLQGVIEHQRHTIEHLQKSYEKSKETIKAAEKRLEDAQSDLAKQVPTSNKELLQQQVKVLKTQRKVLVKEIKDLREQNDVLKNMIATGRKNPT